MPKVKIILPYRHGAISKTYKYGRLYKQNDTFNGSKKNCDAIVSAGKGEYIIEKKKPVKKKKKNGK